MEDGEGGRGRKKEENEGERKGGGKREGTEEEVRSIRVEDA